MLNNPLRIIVGTVVLAILSDAAIAEGNFYVSGAMGNADADISLNAQNRVYGDDDGYTLGGGYTFNQNLSLEVAYKDFGRQSAATDCPPDFACVALVIPLTTTADLKAISVSLIGSIPLTEKFELFGEVGIASWDVDYEGISSAFNTSGEDLLYGAGVRWAINDNWKVFVEYGKIDLDFETAGVGMSYHF